MTDLATRVVVIRRELFADESVQQLFSIPTHSHYRDLDRLIAACLELGEGEGPDRLVGEIRNSIDITTVADSPVDALTTLEQIARKLCDLCDADAQWFRSSLEQEAATAADQKTRLYQNYFSSKPRFAQLYEQLRCGTIGKDRFIRLTYAEVCRTLNEFFGTRQSFITLRKTSAYDKHIASYDVTGGYRAEIYSKVIEPDSSVTDPALREAWIKELEERLKILREPSAPLRSNLTPEQAFVVDECRPIIIYANSDHYQMLHEHAREQFAPLQLCYEYVMYQRALQRQGDLGRFARYDGFCDYLFSVFVPMKLGGSAIGFIKCDRFKTGLGDVTLSESSQEVLTRYLAYLITRTKLHRENIVDYMRDKLPDVREHIFSTLGDEVTDEDEFIKARAIGFLDLKQKLRYFEAIGVPPFEEDDEQLAQLKASFQGERPISRLQMKIAEVYSEFCSETIAKIAMVDELERHGATDALRRIQEERTVISAALTHSGNTETSILATNVSYVKRYLERLEETSGQFKNGFRDFARKFKDNELAIKDLIILARQHDEMFKPLLSRLEDLDVCLERVKELRGLFERFRSTASQMSYYNIHAIIDEAFERVEHLIGTKGIAIDRNYCDTELVVYCHKPYLITALHEYITNAIEALTAKQAADRWITVSTRKDESNIFIEISDNGLGFDLPNPMDVYGKYTSKGDNHGTGLATARRIIEGKSFHGGEVYPPESESGVGTTFKIRLPLRREKDMPDVLTEL